MKDIPLVDFELDFIRESNRIEGIKREPTDAEIEEYSRFMALEQLEIRDFEQFVSVYAPGNYLRLKSNQNVQVGGYVAPRGGPRIVGLLQRIIDIANELKRTNPSGFSQKAQQIIFETHITYEQLHPFTDGNGRSGRMLWWWMMDRCSYGFLHYWYYQTLRDKQKDLPPHF